MPLPTRPGPRGLSMFRRPGPFPVQRLIAETAQMPCEDCQRAIAKLQAEVEALLTAFGQRQEAIFDKMDQTHNKMDATLATVKST